MLYYLHFWHIQPVNIPIKSEIEIDVFQQFYEGNTVGRDVGGQHPVNAHG